jgi:hypothetical protein
MFCAQMGHAKIAVEIIAFGSCLDAAFNSSAICTEESAPIKVITSLLIPTKQAVPILPQPALSWKSVNTSFALDRGPITNRTIKNVTNPTEYKTNTVDLIPGSLLARKILKRIAKE